MNLQQKQNYNNGIRQCSSILKYTTINVFIISIQPVEDVLAARWMSARLW